MTAVVYVRNGSEIKCVCFWMTGFFRPIQRSKMIHFKYDKFDLCSFNTAEMAGRLNPNGTECPGVSLRE